MPQSSVRRRSRTRAVALCLAVVTIAATVGRADATMTATHAVAGGIYAALTTPAAALDSLRGRSGKLRALLVPRSSQRVSVLARTFGDTLVHAPGMHDIRDSLGIPQFTLITMRDFADKTQGRIGAYRIGFWPAEQGRYRVGYDNPRGFIEITPDNMNTAISEHFRLSDFLTHDQATVWPKYLVLREELVDKLELVIAELEREGHPVTHMSVMSGFRTPQYNATGGETGGRAELSRHMYGDAADVFVDNDRDGRMDDLNRDGRVNHRDAQVILDAAERVERRYPDVTGGVGVYQATSSHGPFAHVDVRGYRARWGLL